MVVVDITDQQEMVVLVDLLVKTLLVVLVVTLDNLELIEQIV